MRFDDRLLTVINQPADDRRAVAVRWRQLVDLVARSGPGPESPAVWQAIDLIRDEAWQVDSAVRAAAARGIAGLPLPLGLLEYFVTESLAVAAPVLAVASLVPSQWTRLVADADADTGRFIMGLHPELAVAIADVMAPPSDAPSVSLGTKPDAEPPQRYAPPTLNDMVERIERRRSRREIEEDAPAEIEVAADAGTEAKGEIEIAAQAEVGAAAEPKPEPEPEPEHEASVALFRWECGPGGEIAWVDGAPRGALIGRSLAKPSRGDGQGEGGRAGQSVARAFASRAPFRDESLTLADAGAASGDWKVSGIPAFEPADGRFAGYRGIALREVSPPPALRTEPVTDLLGDPDAVRELVHEIKTPLNAIIGFAEIIEGQFLGPADRGYRERAHDIVGHARLLLTAIDDLDFAARLHSAREAKPRRVDLAALIDARAAEYRDLASRKGVEFDVVRPRFEVPAAVQPELAERLLRRMVGAIVELATRGERLRLSAEMDENGARIVISRPSALRGISDEELFEGRAGAHGARDSFSLRLSRGLAWIAGGDLVGGRDAFILVFPRG